MVVPSCLQSACRSKAGRPQPFTVGTAMRPAVDPSALEQSVPPTFVAIRFPGIGVVLSRHTQAVAGSQADLGVLSAAVHAEGRQYTVLAALRGFTSAQAEEMRRDLEATYGRGPEIVRDTPGEILLRYGWAMKDLRSPFVRALA